MKKILLSTIAVATLSFGSATIFSGQNQSIAIDSEPSGAKVFVAGVKEVPYVISLVYIKVGISFSTFPSLSFQKQV
jgi:hypothetical protein